MTRSDPNRRIKDLVIWLRREQIQWQSLSVDSVTIDGAADLKMHDARPASKPAPAKPTIYEQYGGALVQQTPAADTFAPVIEEDE